MRDDQGFARLLQVVAGVRRLLFLCTGNYYRSRFAEEYWNSRAEQEGLLWRAESRALLDPLVLGNPGPMSSDALKGLAQRGILPRAADREPLTLSPEELAHYERVIALDADEHRPMLARGFPEHVERIEYWDIGDVWKEDPRTALERLSARLELLMREIRDAWS